MLRLGGPVAALDVHLRVCVSTCARIAINRRHIERATCGTVAIPWIPSRSIRRYTKRTLITRVAVSFGRHDVTITTVRCGRYQGTAAFFRVAHVFLLACTPAVRRVHASTMISR